MLSKKGLRSRANSDSCLRNGRRFGDDEGRQDRDQRQLFYEFRLGLRDFPGECKRFLCGLQAAVRIPRCQSQWLMYARQKTLRGSSSTRWLSARAGLGEPLQSGREVGRLSRYPALLRLTHANKVADHHQPP
jgi:hypothetical protein